MSYLSWCCDQTTVQNYLKEGRAHSGSQLEVTGHRGGGSMAAGTRTSWSLRVQSGSRERMPAISSSSIFFKIFFLCVCVCTHLPQQPLEDNFPRWCSPSIMKVLQSPVIRHGGKHLYLLSRDFSFPFSPRLYIHEMVPTNLAGSSHQSRKSSSQIYTPS